MMKPCKTHTVPDGKHFCTRCHMHRDAIEIEEYQKEIAALKRQLAQREADCIHNIAEHARLGSRLGERIAELESQCKSIVDDTAKRLAELERVAEAAVDYLEHLPLHMHDEWATTSIKVLREAGYLKEQG